METLQIIQIIIWGLFCLCLGVYDAILYAYGTHSTETYKINPHIISLILRTIVACGLVYTEYWQDAMLHLFGMAMMFSFLHNGAYYTIRGLFLDKVSGYWWFAQSSTTTAKFSYGGLMRTIYFIIGIIAFTIKQYY